MRANVSMLCCARRWAKPELAKKLKLWPLVAATYFMVSGGPYGLEDLLQSSGYRYALLLILLVPLLWSLPTALMVGELSSAIPDDGGYYVWVKRALGPFWGVQEAWVSLAASIFDMAAYPTLFVLYLERVWPRLQGGGGLAVGAAVIAACALWNIRGAPAVGNASLALGAALLAPFLVMSVAALLRPAVATPAPLHHPALVAGIMVCMWNYMGWDGASTVAGEVERPQRTYPRAMGLAVALVTISYLIPVAAVARTGMDPSQWTTGAWVDAGGALGGRVLALALVAGGLLCGLGMTNALVLSYSRVPLVLAEDGYLPAALAKRHRRNQAPWVSILVLSVAWSLALGLGFERLVELDVLLTGASLVLEFAALAALRVREPGLPRPYRVPGGTMAAALLGLGPTALLTMALWRTLADNGFTRNLALGLALTALGPLLYWAARWRGKARESAAGTEDSAVEGQDD